MHDFRSLRVWHSAKDFCVAVYRVTRSFPEDERFGFTSQMRRSARSISANIAEGCGYRGSRDSARFYEMAHGSSSECHSDLIIANELGFLDQTRFSALEELLVPTRKQLVRLIGAARQRG